MISKYLCVLVLHTTSIALVFKCSSLILPGVVTGTFTVVGKLILFAIIATATFRLTAKKHLNKRLNSENKAVFITGCDTGFGHNLAKHLDSQGFHVFASCFDASGSGAKNLLDSCSKRLKVLQLDVRKDASVKSAFEFVKENLGTLELWALVNNAGIFKTFGIEFTTMDDYYHNMEVNAIGPVRVTKAFLPLLRKSRGRVINLTSIAGRVPGSQLTAYITSKHALAGFNDSLRQELDVWGIRVISMEPEMYKTGLTAWEALSRNMDSSFQATDDEVISAYGKKYFEGFKNYLRKNLQMESTKVFIVINAIEEAISSEHPQVIYRPCRNFFVEFLYYFYEWMPRRVQDLLINISHYVTGFPTPAKA